MNRAQLLGLMAAILATDSREVVGTLYGLTINKNLTDLLDYLESDLPGANHRLTLAISLAK